MLPCVERICISALLVGTLIADAILFDLSYLVKAVLLYVCSDICVGDTRVKSL